MKNKIKVFRAERDWSQQVLADRLTVSRQAVNAIERSKHDPSLQLAFNIAAQFGHRLEDVFFPEKQSNLEDG